MVGFEELGPIVRILEVGIKKPMFTEELTNIDERHRTGEKVEACRLSLDAGESKAAFSINRRWRKVREY